jgi:hypothetical protein
MNKNIRSLLRFDNIRLFKLLEIVYYALISFFVTLLVANILEDDNYMPYIFKNYDYEKASIGKLLLDIIIDLSFLCVFLYYLKKLLSCIPFVLAPLNKKYKASMKGEVLVGIGLGTGIILYTSLFTIKDKLKVLDEKLKRVM